MHPTQTFSYAQSLEPVKLLAMTNGSDATTPNIVGKTMLQTAAKQSVFLRIQVRASSQTAQKVWNEAENRERDFFFFMLRRLFVKHNTSYVSLWSRIFNGRIRSRKIRLQLNIEWREISIWAC